MSSTEIAQVKGEIDTLKKELDVRGINYMVVSDIPQRGLLAKLTDLRDRLREKLDQNSQE